jgi:putative PIN family toxin of toxin-antitoxin system
MNIRRIILDTNVLYAGLYSADGASYQILRAIERGHIQIVVSPTLLFEYEEILYRNQTELGLSNQQIEAILDNLCAVSDHQQIYYLWRTFLPDPNDDHVLEVAIASRTRMIVTHNIKDFKGIEKMFGIRPMTPKEFLTERI